jgi:hypothetical protein
MNLRFVTLRLEPGSTENDSIARAASAGDQEEYPIRFGEPIRRLFLALAKRLGYPTSVQTK